MPASIPFRLDFHRKIKSTNPGECCYLDHLYQEEAAHLSQALSCAPMPPVQEEQHILHLP